MISDDERLRQRVTPHVGRQLRRHPAHVPVDFTGSSPCVAACVSACVSAGSRGRDRRGGRAVRGGGASAAGGGARGRAGPPPPPPPEVPLPPEPTRTSTSWRRSRLSTSLQAEYSRTSASISLRALRSPGACSALEHVVVLAVARILGAAARAAEAHSSVASRARKMVRRISKITLAAIAAASAATSRRPRQPGGTGRRPASRGAEARAQRASSWIRAQRRGERPHRRPGRSIRPLVLHKAARGGSYGVCRDQELLRKASLTTSPGSRKSRVGTDGTTTTSLPA